MKKINILYLIGILPIQNTTNRHRRALKGRKKILSRNLQQKNDTKVDSLMPLLSPIYSGHSATTNPEPPKDTDKHKLKEKKRKKPSLSGQRARERVP